MNTIVIPAPHILGRGLAAPQRVWVRLRVPRRDRTWKQYEVVITVRGQGGDGFLSTTRQALNQGGTVTVNLSKPRGRAPFWVEAQLVAKTGIGPMA